MGNLEVLEEDLDSNYEPTDQEIEEYAQYLGMDMSEDQQLFYIAKEGLKAPLPSHGNLARLATIKFITSTSKLKKSRKNILVMIITRSSS